MISAAIHDCALGEYVRVEVESTEWGDSAYVMLTEDEARALVAAVVSALRTIATAERR